MISRQGLRATFGRSRDRRKGAVGEEGKGGLVGSFHEPMLLIFGTVVG